MAKHDMIVKVEGLDKLEDLVLRLEAVCVRLEAAGIPRAMLPTIFPALVGCGPNPCNCSGACLGHAIGAAE